MKPFNHQKTRIRALAILAILFASAGITGTYAAIQSEPVPLEVKDPLELFAYNPNLSLYPGETLPLTIPVENHASIIDNASLTFRLNDTDYQEKFINFSETLYAIQPGRNYLEAWLFVSSAAPPAQLQLTINITRDFESSPTPSPTAAPTPSMDGFSVSMQLFAAGARWAGKDGTTVLYVNWYDNYVAHHFSDGANWGPYWREGQLGAIKNVTIKALQQQGFTVECVGDVPNDFSSYSLVVFEAWFAIEPKHVQQVRNYLSNGGSVVIIGGAPCYFATYCKDLWPYVSGGENLSSMEDWLGSARFVNSGGTSNLVVDKPFGLPLQNQSQIYHIDAYGCYSLTSMGDDTQIIARWVGGTVYAFNHEYGNGRVYYQAEMDLD